MSGSGKINHLVITAPAARFEEVVQWYTKTLSPLGYIELHRYPGVVGLGPDGHADFWISAKESWAKSPIHIGFSATDHATVDAFHKAGIDAGGECNGPPGLRPQYHPNYYGAFLLDPLGNNIEAVSTASISAVEPNGS
ncbi:glyoxalase family protein [Penicillium sp. IBT 18751x]|nr:glyoxalase family protein [Penicillium sp. IBT 18751x]